MDWMAPFQICTTLTLLDQDLRNQPEGSVSSDRTCKTHELFVVFSNHVVVASAFCISAAGQCQLDQLFSLKRL
jgi:hypothetical protein